MFHTIVETLTWAAILLVFAVPFWLYLERVQDNVDQIVESKDEGEADTPEVSTPVAAGTVAESQEAVNNCP